MEMKKFKQAQLKLITVSSIVRLKQQLIEELNVLKLDSYCDEHWQKSISQIESQIKWLDNQLEEVQNQINNGIVGWNGRYK